MSIHRAITAYFGKTSGEHSRERSWEHCYRYFRLLRQTGLAADRNHAALHLGFYLASWGMYRGSSFLRNYAYTVHDCVVDRIQEKPFDELWNTDFGEQDAHRQLIPRIRELIDSIRKAYIPFATSGSSQPTDTLITKVILGTFGCLPACDRYFLDGFKREGFEYTPLNNGFVDRIFNFCQQHLSELQQEQASIEQGGGIRYPLMKLVDMYFWQIGREAESKSVRK